MGTLGYVAARLEVWNGMMNATHKQIKNCDAALPSKCSCHIYMRNRVQDITEVVDYPMGLFVLTILSDNIVLKRTADLPEKDIPAALKDRRAFL